ncbi:MAG: hypothetical protein ACKV2O_17385 [Acidimicrobiales bacterium]
MTGFDTVAYSGPNLQLTLDAMRAGRLAGWNDAIYGGVPHLGNIHAAAFYPLKWPFAWSGMGVHRAWLLLVALHVVLLGAGMFWLARRRLGLAPPAAGLACVVVVGSGAVMIRMLFFEQIMVLAWAPWLLGAIDAALRNHRRGAAVTALALVTALTLTAGHVQVVYLVVVLAAVWTAARALDSAAGCRAMVPGVSRVGLGAGLGVLLAAPQLWPSAVLARASANRGDRALATISNPGYSVQIRRLPGTWFGDPLAPVHSVTTAGYENLTFVGVVGAALSLVGLVVLWQRRQRATAAALGAIVAVSLLLAIGPRLLPYRVAFRLVPGFSAARVPARWALLAVLAAALLAAVGVDGLRSGQLGRRAGLLVVGVLAAAAAAVVVLPFDNPPAATLAVWAGLAALVAATVIATTVLRPADPNDPSNPSKPDPVARTDPACPDRAHPGDQPDRGADTTVPAVPANSTNPASRLRRVDGAPRMAGVVAALIVTVTVGAAAELGLAARHSAARASSAPRPYTEVAASPLLTWLRDRPGRVLALTSDQVNSLDQVTLSLRPNANVTAGLRSVDGYDGGIQVTKTWVAAWQPLVDDVIDPESPIRSQLALPLDPVALAGLGVRWVLIDTVTFNPATALPAWKGPVRAEGDLAVFENPAYQGEAWWERPLPPGATPGPEGWTGTRIDIESPAVQHVRPGVLRLNIAVVPSEAGGPTTTPAEATITNNNAEASAKDAAATASAATPTLSARATLVIAEQWDPGWSATVDGQPVDVQRAGPMRMGLDIPTGTRLVELRYHAVGLRPGLILAVVAVGALVALMRRDRVTHSRR